MVVTLTGTVDSVPVTFRHVEGDEWQCTVPPDVDDGIYIVELTATDDAGNQGYYTAVLYVWQHIITDFRLFDQRYSFVLLADRYICEGG